MTPTDRPSLGQFLIKTKKGRTILLAAVLGGVLVLVPTLAGPKKAAAAAPQAAPGSQAPGSDLPPSPTGFGETLTLGQKYDALISRFGGDLTSTKAELDTTRKELETLRATLKAERTSQEKERKDLGETLRQMKENLVRETSQPIAHRPPDGQPQGAVPVPGGLRSIELGPPAPRDRKERKWVRIPTASGAIATLNASRSSAVVMASRLAPMSSTS